jgi:syntaxin 5
VVKSKSSFEDKPVEIQELTFVIKQDIERLNRQIAGLEQYKRSNNGSSNMQKEEHSNNVVVSLQTKLATASTSFKDILEVRTTNMKAQKERRQQYSSGSSSILPEIGQNSKADFVAKNSKTHLSLY